MIRLFKASTPAEMSQTIPTKFAFCRKEEDDIIAVHNLVQCRDFLGDVLYATANNKKIEIYGFKFDATQQHINKDKLELLLHFPSIKVKNAFKKNYQKVLSTFDISLNEIEFHPKNYCYISADKYWQSRIYLISLFTFLLKCACHYTDNWSEEVIGTEKEYIDRFQYNIVTEVNNALDKLNEVEYTVDGLKEEQGIHSVHNYCGFVSVMAQSNIYKSKNNYAQYLCQ